MTDPTDPYLREVTKCRRMHSNVSENAELDWTLTNCVGLIQKICASLDETQKTKKCRCQDMQFFESTE